MERLLGATRARKDRVERRGSAYFQWLLPQLEFLQAPERFKLLRLGNQWGGKTTAGLTEVDWRCTGRHPWLKTKRPPVEAWIICASWQQSVAIQQKFWDLCDRDELADDVLFDPVKGFKGKNPCVRYRNGSIVRFKTTGQGGLNLASATIDVVLIDEPTAQRIFEELKKRVMKRNGVILMTLTPINGPTDYLRELAEQGAVRDVHYPLRAELLIPVGGKEPLRLVDGTAMDSSWVAQVRKETLAREEPIIVDGEWETRVEGNVFKAFDPNPHGEHITDLFPTGDLTVCLGIDHGAKDFKQVAVLVALEHEQGWTYPKVHVLDEYVGTGETTTEDDAAAIIAMLRRWGVPWAELKHVMGDKPYDAGKVTGRIGRKSNAELQAAIAAELGMRRGEARKLRPFIRQAKTGKGGGRGSIEAGTEWLHKQMVRPGHFTVQRRCVRVIEALEKWDWTDSDWKDPIDAIRYATWLWAIRGAKGTREGRGASVYVY